MPDLDDIEYQTPDPGPSGANANRRGVLPVVAVVLGLLVLSIGAYLWWRRAPAPVPAQTAAVEAPPAPPTAPPDASGARRDDLPPLDGSDAFMREQFGALSSSAAMTVWLRGSGLARNLAVVLENTSRGVNPSKHLRRLAPSGSFRTMQRGNRIVIDPRNYQRFAPIAAAASSIDPEMAARLYVGIKPLLQIAYDELGNQEPIDRAVERATRQLLSAPVAAGDIVLEEAAGEGIGYRFANPAFESLPGVQKQLIRMGPATQRTIQERLRQFAMAAGLAVDTPPAVQ